MLRQKVETISITLSLVIISVVLNWAHYSKMIDYNPIFPTTMLLCTAVDLFGGCMLQTFGHRKAALALATITFFILCTCFIYSVRLVDYISFAGCMLLVIRKAVKTCNCMSDCENPFI